MKDESEVITAKTPIGQAIRILERRTRAIDNAGTVVVLLLQVEILLLLVYLLEK